MTPERFMHRLVALLLGGGAGIASADAAVRSFDFEARVAYAPLLRSLPNHTAIYHEWPPEKLRKTLPDSVSAALIATPHVADDDDDLPLVGPPIHVQAGDILSVKLKNSLSTTGLSLHWHGFEMTNALEYDGVVGVTQCPIAPNTQFVYEFAVEETPGTYWWHTHSGTMGIHAMNSIHGPLIVHPDGEESRQLVDRLNGASNDTDERVDPWYYENERILFFKDGFVHPDAVHLEGQMGGLNAAISKDDSGNTVGTSAWEFGTCNGRMREIVPVSAGQTYRFRLINGGVHYGLRINIADLEMIVVAADSEPVEPVVVNEVFLHAAERFDVEVTIPDDWVDGGAFWIRADTIESAYQGYSNGVRAILKVSSKDESVERSGSLFSHSLEVYDPVGSIKSPIGRDKDHLTLNCFERKTYEGAPYGGRCLQLTALSQQAKTSTEHRVENYDEDAEVHVIDSHFQPYPQHSHFIRFDGGPFYQHVNPVKSMLDPTFGPDDMHPHTAELHVSAFSTVVLVWRSTTLMDHPMHLHGLKMEILDIVLPEKQRDCTLSKCKLNSVYESPDAVRALAASVPLNKAVLKDTFVMPAGGAVVTRIYTQEPSLWYSHCHLEMHHFDGMAFILNVGNYTASSSKRNLPNDMPSCDSPIQQTRLQYPSCDCYENPNTVLSTFLTSDYKCSRDHLCHHVHSRAANLDRYHFEGGDVIHSNYAIPGYAISFIALAAVCTMLIVTRQIVVWLQSRNEQKQVYKGAANLSVDVSVNAEMPGSTPTGATMSQPSSKRRLSTMSTRSFSDNEDHTGPESTSGPKQRSTRHLLRDLLTTDAKPESSTERSNLDRRSVMRTYKTASSRSWRESARSVTTLGIAAASDAPSCIGSNAAIASDIERRPEGTTRKDYVATWEHVSERSWADSAASDARSMERSEDGNSNRERSSSRNLLSNKPKGIIRSDSSDSVLSLISSVIEADETNERRDRSCSNVSELSEPPQSPKEAKRKPSRRVSFDVGIAPQKLAIAETAKPVAQHVQSAFVNDEKQDVESNDTSGSRKSAKTSARVDASSTFVEQLKHILYDQYRVYRPLCVNGLRVFEVCSLGILTGFLFYDVGNNTSFQGMSQRLSIYFFSTTLWTFTRMYPSVGFSFQWALLYQVDFKQKRYSLGPVVLGRLIVVLGLESFWPLIYAFVCYPFASVFGSIKVVILVGLFLLLNNLCYISLGSLLGVTSKKVPLGMIASTIFSQTSLVAAGFYTKLPPALDWIRYISPFYWSFRGIIKSCFSWNDTLECFKGSSDVGANQCYLEYHVAIDQYKERGINVATYNDPSSNTVYLEYICLVLLLLFMNFLIFLKAWFVCRRFERQSEGVAAGDVERPSVSRRDSISHVILSRFDSSGRARGSDQANSARRLVRSISSRVRTIMSSNRDGVDGEDTRAQTDPPAVGAARQDSMRDHVIQRLKSSNVLTWK